VLSLPISGPQLLQALMSRDIYLAGALIMLLCVLTLIGTRDGTELMTTIAGGMRLGDYLPTRTFELAVHTADLATALGVSPDVPATAAAQALAIIADLAVTDGLAGPLLLAATGRPGLPAGFSVL